MNRSRLAVWLLMRRIISRRSNDDRASTADPVSVPDRKAAASCFFINVHSDSSKKYRMDMLTWISPKESPDHVHSKFNFLYKYQHLEPKKYGHDFFPEKISYVVNPCEFCTLGALKCWKVPFRRGGVPSLKTIAAEVLRMSAVKPSSRFHLHALRCHALRRGQRLRP